MSSTVPVRVSTPDRVETFHVAATAFDAVAHLIDFIGCQEEHDFLDPNGIYFAASEEKVCVVVWGEDPVQSAALFDAITEAWRAVV